jgi:hypothetical protein
VSDRLDDFRRQRDLLREHLDWLEHEIAALEGTSAPAPMAARPSYAERASPPMQARAPVSDLDAEAILAEYRQPSVSIQKQAMFVCLLYFALALVVMAAFVTAVYLFVQRAHAR